MFPSAIFNICIVLIIASKFSLTIGASREVVSNINTTSCGDKIERLEHVEAHITFECTRRGEVELFLTSAQGTKSKLLTKRQKDNSSATSFSWKFMSVHYWGENPSGTWSLKMRVKESSFTGSLKKWKLVFFGTKDNQNIKMNENDSLITDFTKRANTNTAKGNTTEYIVGVTVTVGILIIICNIGLVIYFAVREQKKKIRVS